jgi:hypothetical protein
LEKTTENRSEPSISAKHCDVAAGLTCNALLNTAGKCEGLSRQRKPLASTLPFAKNAFTCLFARLPFAIFQQDHTGKA